MESNTKEPQEIVLDDDLIDFENDDLDEAAEKLDKVKDE
jgi:hypothetical protein